MLSLARGIFAEKGNGRKTPWVWKDFNGKWHFTRGMAPRPFLRPAVEEHIDEQSRWKETRRYKDDRA